MAKKPARRPARPLRPFRQQRSLVSYEKLLGAAAAHFSEHGFRTTQVPDIARRAGLSVGAFYRYFDDKRAIFIALSRVFLQRQHEAQASYLAEWQRRIVAGEADGRAFLEEAIPVAARQQAVNPDLLRTFVAMSYEDDEVGALRSAYDEADRRDLARFFAAVIPRERLPSPLAAARLFDLTVEEVVRWAWLQGGTAPRAVQRELVEMLDRYLFGRPETPARRGGRGRNGAARGRR